MDSLFLASHGLSQDICREATRIVCQNFAVPQNIILPEGIAVVFGAFFDFVILVCLCGGAAVYNYYAENKMIISQGTKAVRRFNIADTIYNELMLHPGIDRSSFTNEINLANNSQFR